jgi:ubiquinone/menaquinone biosynthesis C-methylase UbiE
LSLVYNLVSRSRIFQGHYTLLARDIIARGPSGNILDIGTGPGWLLLKLHECCPDARLAGVDISHAMVAVAKRNVSRAAPSGVIDTQVASAEHLPFADESFDKVVSTGSIHHWKDPERALAEVYRVLRPGGQALMYDLVADTPPEVLDHLKREHGRFRVMLLWLHSFEEPFCSVKEFASLGHTTPFARQPIRFVGALCCLAMNRLPFPR